MAVRAVKTGYDQSFSLSEAAAFLVERIEKRLGKERAAHYYHDPVAFVREIIRAEPTPDQVEILEALAEHNHVAVRSGHGIGKSAGIAFTILWFISTRRMPKIPITAPTSHQLEDILWSELIKWCRNMEPSFRDQFEHTSEKFYHKEYKEEWYCVARTARKEKPEALQGFHGENLLFVLEEAAGIPDEIFEVSQGSITSKDNMVLAVGNPTRLSGFFYDCFHRDRARWHTLHYSSLKSPLVDPSYSERMKAKYGEGSNIYRVRVLGEFPTSEEDQLIPLDVLEAAVNRDIPETGSIVWGLDVARFGSDETVLCKRHGDVIKELRAVRGYDTMQVTGWVIHEIERAAPEEKPTTICIDSIGYGAGCADRLRELRHNALDVQVSERPSHKEKYYNLRAELWWEFRDWLQAGIGSLPDDEDLLAQASSIKYKFHSSGKLMVEKKEDLKKRGLPSPDRADALCLTFYQPKLLFPNL
jgi:hypothetical protein